MKRHRPLIALCVLAGCSGAGPQSAAWSAGPQAERIKQLGGFFLVLLGVIYLAVLVALGLALLRSRRVPVHGDRPELDSTAVPENPSRPVGVLNEGRERTFRRAVMFCVGLASALLFVLLLESLFTGHALSTFSQTPARVIKIIGHQWWWELRYLDADPTQFFITANELHLPVGQPVRLELESADVIHSFWVPALHGKRDLIPGWSSSTTVQVDRPGEYRGQCAEFCGYQHAQMGLRVIAEPPEQFRAWMDAQRAAAVEPTAESARRGQQVFTRGPCAMCHTIRGTSAGGGVAPELTHLASRRYLAAGALPNNRGNLAGWIVNSQTIKPGSHMPAMGLEAGALQDLLDYLEVLR